ncbi:MAG: SDR family oxidoreductase [Methylocella sp.]
MQGKKIIIVGGTSGIGLTTASLAVQQGAEVVVAGRDADEAQRAAFTLGQASQGIAFDAADVSAVRPFFDGVGPFDHLVLALSGRKGGGPFVSVSEQDIREGFNAKFFLHWSLAQASLQTLRKTGSITFITAASARVGNPGTAGLAAINGAIQALIEPLAAELKPVRVNAVSPGIIDTPWWNRPGQEDQFAAPKRMTAATPVGRAGRPEEVASAICFLIGNEFMTGAVIDCDGGIRLK